MITKIVFGEKTFQLYNTSNFTVKEGEDLWLLEDDGNKKVVKVESITKVINYTGEAWEEIKVREK